MCPVADASEALCCPPTAEAEAKERETAEQKRRQREQEEYRYSFAREQQLAKEQFADEKARLERELALRKEEAERQLETAINWGRYAELLAYDSLKVAQNENYGLPYESSDVRRAQELFDLAPFGGNREVKSVEVRLRSAGSGPLPPSCPGPHPATQRVASSAALFITCASVAGLAHGDCLIDCGAAALPGDTLRCCHTCEPTCWPQLSGVATAWPSPAHGRRPGRGSRRGWQ